MEGEVPPEIEAEMEESERQAVRRLLEKLRYDVAAYRGLVLLHYRRSGFKNRTLRIVYSLLTALDEILKYRA